MQIDATAARAGAAGGTDGRMVTAPSIPHPDAGHQPWMAWLDREIAATERRIDLGLAAAYGRLAGRGDIGPDALNDVLKALAVLDDLGEAGLGALLDGLHRRRGRAPRRWVS